MHLRAASLHCRHCILAMLCQGERCLRHAECVNEVAALTIGAIAAHRSELLAQLSLVLLRSRTGLQLVCAVGKLALVAKLAQPADPSCTNLRLEHLVPVDGWA